ncbi:MAG: 3-phosphoshikimate 1-carboxyvinyltransferase, partial [Thermodesulfatator sp.]
MTIEITVPGSKSITQRALVAAALSQGESVLGSALDSEDTRLLRNALVKFGVNIDDSQPDSWKIQGTGGNLREPRDEIFMGNNGTGIRFLISLASLVHGTTILTGTPRMEERPAAPLLDALAQLWV